MIRRAEAEEHLLGQPARAPGGRTDGARAVRSRLGSASRCGTGSCDGVYADGGTARSGPPPDDVRGGVGQHRTHADPSGHTALSDSDPSLLSVLAALARERGPIAIAKGVAAVLTGSAALFAETLHTVADAGNEVFLFVAIRRSARDPPTVHPFGYGPERYYWALLAALGMFVARRRRVDLARPPALFDPRRARGVLGRRRGAGHRARARRPQPLGRASRAARAGADAR